MIFELLKVFWCFVQNFLLLPTLLTYLMMAFSHQLIECPSVYELMANPEFNWPRVPHLSIWRDYIDSMGQHSVKLESYGPKDLLPILTEALNKNTVMCGFQHVFKFFGKQHKNPHTCWVFNRTWSTKFTTTLGYPCNV